VRHSIEPSSVIETSSHFNTHDGLAPTDHDPDSRPESPSLETPSKSQGNMFSITPEEVVASPHGNGSGDGEHAKWFDQFIS
jgi:hypothetical protein